MAETDLSSVIESYLARQGGTVVERLVTVCKSIYKEDAPELESDEALKAFVATKPETFKVVTSVNSVERIKLVNPPKRERRKPNGALLTLIMKQLTEQVRRPPDRTPVFALVTTPRLAPTAMSL